MNHLRTRFVLALFILGASVTSACSPSSPASTAAPLAPSTSQTISAAPAAEPTETPPTLVDAAGQTVELAQLPTRLVVVGKGPHMSLHLLYMFPTAWGKVVGLEQKGVTADDFLPYVDPDWSRKSVLASGPNAEQIAALRPDLVIMKGTVMDALSETLAEVRIPCMFLALEPPERFFQDVAKLGQVLGDPQRAAEIAAYYGQRLDRIRQRTADIAEGQKPRVLLLEYTDRGGSLAVQVPARSWMQTIQVQLAGGHPVWLENAAQTDGWTVVNLEQIALWNPDKIFLVIAYSMDASSILAKLKGDPLWSNLRAVQNNELYAFPCDLYGWDNPGPRWILGLSWLATRLYPDRFADIDMNAEVHHFFSYFFNMDQKAVNDHIMPTVQMNVR